MTLKLVTEPSVYVLGRQVIQPTELDRFLLDHGVTWETDTEVGGEVLSEVAGRLCYMSFAKPRPGGNKSYLDHILEVGHGSVLEHAVWNFALCGISRTCSHELVRHRQGVAYSQLSQRYVDESQAEYVVPRDLQPEVAAAVKAILDAWPAAKDFGLEHVGSLLDSDQYPEPEDEFDRLTDQERVGLVWLRAVLTTHADYVTLGDYLVGKAARERPDLAKTDARKYARQAARSVLTNATETKVAFTANVRALRHILEMRVSRHAEPEIRVLFHKVWLAMVKEAPNFFSDYEEVALPDGTFELTTKHRKV